MKYAGFLTLLSKNTCLLTLFSLWRETFKAVESMTFFSSFYKFPCKTLPSLCSLMVCSIVPDYKVGFSQPNMLSEIPPWVGINLSLSLVIYFWGRAIKKSYWNYCAICDALTHKLSHIARLLNGWLSVLMTTTDASFLLFRLTTVTLSWMWWVGIPTSNVTKLDTAWP